MPPFKVGILSMGFADQSRDFDAIVDGLIDEFESLPNLPADEWSVDWTKKYAWDSPLGAPKEVAVKPRRRPALANTNNIDVFGYFVQSNDPAHAAGLAGTMWTPLVGMPTLDILVGSSTIALQKLRDTRPSAGNEHRPIIMAFTGDDTQVITNTGKADRDHITGVVDHSHYQLEVQVDVLKRMYAGWGGTNPYPRLYIIRNATNLGKDKEIKELGVLMGGMANIQEVKATSAADLTPASLAVSLKNAEMALVLGDPLIMQNASNIRDYFDGLSTKIPVMFGAPESAENGGIVACGPSHESLFLLGAQAIKEVVDRLSVTGNPHANTPAQGIKLKGPRPSDIELVLNHKAREDKKWPDFPPGVRNRKHAKHIR